jgi:hypothetical protein
LSIVQPTGRIVTYHVVRERRGRQMLVGVRMLSDRWRLRRVPGLHLAKVLGTGCGFDTGPSIDLRRQAYLLVWDDPEPAARFVAGHRLAARWHRIGVQYEGALGLVDGHGTWSGRSFLDGIRRVDPGQGPVIVVTRARIRVRAWRAFRRASRATRDVALVPGVDWVIGVGEWPLVLVGTLSRWESSSAIDRFVVADQAHGAAARHGAEWFEESMFARFAPIDVDGIS